jgi:uncharacterized protein YjgD (DUF1641 family)
LKVIAQASPNKTNLAWFIQHILTKRLSSQSSQNVLGFFHELIKGAGGKEGVEMTLWQGLEIFKKCLLIDEDQLLKVLNRAPSQTQVIKNYLKELGQFLGGMTIA